MGERLPRVTPTRQEMDLWSEVTRDMGHSADRVDANDFIHAAELRLVNRLARLHRLLRLGAPQMIVDRERGMVAQSIGMVLGLPDPDGFSLHSYRDSRGGEVMGG